jgi:hypothetical protein
MRIFAFTMAWWQDHEHAWKQAKVLNQWFLDVQEYYRPVHVFVACGTWSDPIHSPLPRWVPIVNGGVTKDRPYDSVWWNYAGTALIAGLSHALTRSDWDMLILHDTDMLVGAVDFDALLREFLERPETFLCSDWHGRPGGGSITVWKRQAAVKWINQRKRPNFIEHAEGDPNPILLEDEMGEIHKGEWWQPWSQFQTMRQDYGLESAQYVGEREPLEKQWPFCRLPAPSIIAEYEATQTSRAKPVLADLRVGA